VNWSSVFCMFGMALTRPSLIIDVFVHVCGKKADTLSNYCDNIQPYDKICFSLWQMWHDFRLFFLNYEKLELITFAKYCGNILRVWWEVLYGFCGRFTSLSSSERISKICKELTKLSPWVWCTTFFGTHAQCVHAIH